MQSNSHPNKENIMYVLMELLSDGFNSDDASERWINMINRGGLWTITDQTYTCSIFMIMEEEVRKHCTLAFKNKELLCTATCKEVVLNNNDLLKFDQFLKYMLCNILVKGCKCLCSNRLGYKTLPVMNKCICCSETMIATPHSCSLQSHA